MRILPSLPLVLLVAASPALAQIYKWTDANGQVHYADRPASDRATEIRPSVPTAQATPATPSPNAGQIGTENAAVTSEQVRAVQQERARLRDEQCKQATEAYDKALRAARIYRTNDKGEREFLSAAEADATRAQLRAERDSSCAR